MNKHKYSQLINQNNNLLKYCFYESNNYNTQCWIIKKSCFGNLDTSYIFKTNNKLKKIKISSRNFNIKNKILFFENNVFKVYLQVKKNWYKY
jgi:hypothetical protein